MSMSREDHAWIKEKKSWIITTNANERGTFEPRDPPTGRWTEKDLAQVLGTHELTLLPLEGKWTGEVLIHATHGQRDGAFRNELAGHLARESLGERHALYGPVLMTLRELLDHEPPEKRMTLGELLEWARPVE